MKEPFKKKYSPFAGFINLFKSKTKKVEEKRKIKELFREKYSYFQRVLQSNNHVLSLMADIEEKLSGEYLFDSAYIEKTVKSISDGVEDIIKNINFLSDNKYQILEKIYKEICEKIEKILTRRIEIPEIDYVISIEKLTKDSLNIAGGKIAHLAELRNELKVNTPEGFVITSFAFIKFLETANLKDKISEIINSIDINKIEDLEKGSKEIQELIINAEIPTEIENAIKIAYQELCNKIDKKCNVSIRSSAIHEDSDFSFAGQYSSYLNVPEHLIPYYYKKVVASLFNKRAIFYYKTKGFSEAEMAMAVGVLRMVNAKAGGVIYSKNPNDPERENIIISAIRGIGKLIVDGTVTPETYVISRFPEMKILEKMPGKQKKMLICKEEGDLEEIPLPDRSSQFALNEKEIIYLANTALQVENYYGSPQDIEWAIDEDGTIFILQARPLRITEKRAESKVVLPTRIKGYNILLEGGVTACRGVGYGKAFVLQHEEELQNFPEGAVLVAKHTDPKYVVVMNKASAIITDVGSPTGHMASLSREYNVPTLIDVERATKIIKNGQEITVDATHCVIYEGKVDELIEAHKKVKEPFKDTILFKTLEKVVKHIVPLTLIDPTSPDFKPENCKTFHDITRFCHEMVMHEMFTMWDKYDSEHHAVPLLAGIPIGILILDIEGGLKEGVKKATPEDILSIPFKAILKGMTCMEWPGPPPVDTRGFLQMIAHTASIPEEQLRETAKKSFCVLTKNYMNFSIRLGYHFSQIEAYAGENINDNYIKFFLKGGGAAADRRLRRIWMTSEILKKMGFRVKIKEDITDAIITKYSTPEIEKRLEILGRLTAYTKQLDMVLFNDIVAQMYKEEFINKYVKDI